MRDLPKLIHSSCMVLPTTEPTGWPRETNMHAQGLRGKGRGETDTQTDRLTDQSIF